MRSADSKMVRSPYPKTVPDSRLGEDQGRRLGVRLYFFPKMPHINPEVLGVFDGIGAPDLLEDLSMGHDLSGVFHEQTQDIVFRGRQTDQLSVHFHCSTGEVDLQRTDL